MGCGYMGCRTPVNKAAWAVFATLLALAAVLLGIGLAKVAPCTRELTNCTKANATAYLQDKEVCTIPYRQCARSHLIVAGAGVVCLLVGVVVLMCMCCCSKPPAQKPAAGQPYGNMTGIQIAGYPTAAPAGLMGQQQQQFSQPYGYPPYSQYQQMPQQPATAAHQASLPVTRY